VLSQPDVVYEKNVVLLINAWNPLDVVVHHLGLCSPDGDCSEKPNNRVLPHPEHLHHLIPQVIDDLHRNPPGLRFIERA
jgi:hypothetical protein